MLTVATSLLYAIALLLSGPLFFLFFSVARLLQRLLANMADSRSSDRSASALLALASVLLALSLITVILRFYARRHQKASIQWDDWMTLPALVNFSPPPIPVGSLLTSQQCRLPLSELLHAYILVSWLVFTGGLVVQLLTPTKGVSLKVFGYSVTDLTKEQIAATKERSAKVDAIAPEPQSTTCPLPMFC